MESQIVYEFRDAEKLLTPALLVYPEIVDANIRATLRLMNGDANRWRPHIKTAKIASVIRQMIAHGVRSFKCATTLELLTACEAGADDVLLAFPVTGANARRTAEIARQFPAVRVSVLVESREQLALWIDTEVGIFIDVNPGMNRTGISQERSADILELARNAGDAFRGLHYYDGHAEGAAAAAGYDRLLEIVSTLPVGEVITSGTPATQAALAHAGLSSGKFQHRVSPGTVVYNDMSSLKQLPGLGYQAAVMVLATVISHPAPGMFTCDAGHKSVSADAGVPTCQVAGHPEYQPMKPSEEHLPMKVEASLCVNSSGTVPEIGSLIYLMPRHVCPTVNNFDEAVMVAGCEIRGFERVSARGHESGVSGLKSAAR
jgi:D-serine deaminase-like pyridoxal phosphate-dependent protein